MFWKSFCIRTWWQVLLFLNSDCWIRPKLFTLALLDFFSHTLQAHDFSTSQPSYKRFRRRIVSRGSGEGPAASTPLSARWQQELSFDFDTVRQRLELDSPPRNQTELQQDLQRNPATGGHHHYSRHSHVQNLSCESKWLCLCLTFIIYSCFTVKYTGWDQDKPVYWENPWTGLIKFRKKKLIFWSTTLKINSAKMCFTAMGLDSCRQDTIRFSAGW